MAEQSRTEQVREAPSAITSRSFLQALPAETPLFLVYLTFGLFLAGLNAWSAFPDLWVRLATGRLVLDEWAIPRNDPFSFSVPGRAWIDHEWLPAIAMYLIAEVNFEMLVILCAVLAFLPYHMMYRLVLKDRGSDWLLIAFVGFVIFAGWRTYPIRPQLLNPLLFVALIWLIDDRRRNGTGKVLFAPLLMLAWANLQGGFVLGLGVLGAWMLVCLWERRDVKLSLILFVAASAATFINPYGWELHRYTLWASATSNVDRQFVPEWMTPDFHDPLNWPNLAAIVVAVLMGTRNVDPFRRLLLAGTLVANLTSARLAPFMLLSLLYAVGPELPPVELHRLARKAFVLGGVAFFTLGLLAAVSTATYKTPTADLPLDEIAYVHREYPGARVFANVTIGSYQVWIRDRVFFDARSHQVYPEELNEDYQDIMRTRRDWVDDLDKWRIDVVMADVDSDLADAMPALGWRKTYEGEVAEVWARPAGG